MSKYNISAFGLNQNMGGRYSESEDCDYVDSDRANF